MKFQKDFAVAAFVGVALLANTPQVNAQDDEDEPHTTTTRTTTTTTTTESTSTYTINSKPKAAPTYQSRQAAQPIAAPRTTTRYSNETPAEFLQRYFTAKRRAGSPQALNTFFLSPKTGGSPSKDEKNEFDEEKLCTPQKAIVVYSKNRGGYLQVNTRSHEVVSGRAAPLDISGKYILYKTLAGWLIYSEYSKLDEGDGNELSFGSDPDAKPEPISTDQSYQRTIVEAFKLVLKPSPRSSGDVTAQLRNSSSGALRILSIKDAKGSQSAVQEVTAMIANAKIPPMPANTGTPIIHLQLRWSPNTIPYKVVQFFK